MMAYSRKGHTSLILHNAEERCVFMHLYPVCGKATFLHHDYTYYSNFRCCDKKCNRISSDSVIPNIVTNSTVSRQMVKDMNIFQALFSNILIDIAVVNPALLIYQYAYCFADFYKLLHSTFSCKTMLCALLEHKNLDVRLNLKCSNKTQRW